MKITMVDVNNKQPSSFKIHRPNGWGGYLFVLFKSTANVMADGEYRKVSFGECIFFEKGKMQSYYPEKGEEFLHDFIHFDFENEFERIVFSEIPTGKIIKLTFPDTVSATLSMIRNEMMSHTAHKGDILTAMGMVFFYRVRDELIPSDTLRKRMADYRCLYDLRREIYQNPEKDWSIENICKTVCISSSYFKHLYKKLFEVSCTEDVINARIDNAKTLLISSNMPISDVADRCGYNNTEHFIRQFKARVGVSPNKFRK